MSDIQNAFRLIGSLDLTSLSHDDTEEKIAAVTELYDKMGVRALCDEKIRFYFERAREILDKVNLPEERKEPLWEMAQSLLNRKS